VCFSRLRPPYHTIHALIRVHHHRQQSSLQAPCLPLSLSLCDSPGAPFCVMAASIQFACPARALKPNTSGLLFLLSPDGRTTHGVLLPTLEGRQNSRNGLSRPPCFLSCCPGRRPMSPRSAQHEAILYIPGRSSSPAVPELFTARSSFLREAFGLSHYVGLGNPYLPRIRDPSFLAAHETQSPPCYSIIASPCR
jgi:hypothetical protein